jgi:hypothetical protein
MSVEDVDKIDLVTGERKTGDMILTISDHLDWGENEGEHLLVLQKKLNTYLEFIESGQIYANVPQAAGRKAKKFYRLAGEAIEDAGFSLRFELLEPK